MAIKKWILSGDTHGRVAERLGNIKRNMDCGLEKETAVIILGDAGLNFYLNKTDIKEKKRVEEYGMYVYCVRGNHEERPQNLGYELRYDKHVDGEVYQDPYCHLLRYFQDGGIYTINGYRVLTIGGAYSVDKYWRLQNAKSATWSGWFEDEQLYNDEKNAILNKVRGQSFDFVLTHTAPISWEPNDLFLPMIDQSNVDKGMEFWLEEVKRNINYNKWCFAHFHADRLERPNVFQMFFGYYDMDGIFNMTDEDRALLPKSPNYNNKGMM